MLDQMKPAVIAFALLTCFAANAQTNRARFESQVLPVLAKQCFQCHGEKAQIAGLNFASFRNDADAAAKPELWAKVRDKIANRLMPPPPLAALSAGDAAAITSWIDG